MKKVHLARWIKALNPGLSINRNLVKDERSFVTKRTTKEPIPGEVEDSIDLKPA